MTDEGVAQLFVQKQLGNKKIVGTVGNLQFDVIKYRLQHEYKAKCEFRPINFYKAYWLTCEKESILDDFQNRKAKYVAIDKDKNIVFLAQSPYILDMTKRDYPDITFHETSEFKRAVLN